MVQPPKVPKEIVSKVFVERYSLTLWDDINSIDGSYYEPIIAIPIDCFTIAEHSQDLIIAQLRDRVTRLEQQLSEYSWKDNPDRMGS